MMLEEAEDFEGREVLGLHLFFESLSLQSLSLSSLSLVILK
jgi:hypothetical protein